MSDGVLFGLSRWSGWDGCRRLRTVMLAVAVLLHAPGAALAEGSAAGEVKGPAKETEAKIKVAYVYNFLKFIEWPEGDGNAAAPARICVVGTDPIRTMLGELSIRTVKERRIQVEQVKDLSDLNACHLVYVSRSEEAALPQVLRRIEGAPVLSVSDIPEFAHKGGMIGFATEDNRVKIEVNQSLVRHAGLKVSAKLMEIARLVP